MSAFVPKDQWFSSGNDFIIDGLWGRLGVQESFGETRISGATNGLAAVEHRESGKIFVYAGSVNGGLYLRSYDKDHDRWSSEWTWLTKPGQGYQGSQGTAIINASPDGKYLAVGQGNASNYSAVSAPSQGLQIGQILDDGTVAWVELSERDRSLLAGLNVRSLVWRDARIDGTAWDSANRGSSFTLTFDGQSISDLEVKDRGLSNLVADGVSGFLLEGGCQADTGLPVLLLNGRDLQESDSGKPISFFSDERIARVSVYPRLIDGNVIAFVGTFLDNPAVSANPIWRIQRLEIDPISAEVVGRKSTNPTPPYLSLSGGLNTSFGSNQGSNDFFYGNFSFEADPYDPNAKSIFVGGNHYQASPLAASTLYTGGLVKVSFSGRNGIRQTPLYGPRITRSRAEYKSGEVDVQDVLDGKLVVPFDPGAPHADSRSITFLDTAQGTRLVQTDDGGVWQLPLKRSPKGLKQSKGDWWTSLSGPGMATLEINQVDWNSATNSIITSYQDNSSSIGYLGDRYATNFAFGDGQIALFDDSSQGSVRGYIAPQRYYQNGNVLASDYDANGFVKNRSDKRFYLLDRGELASWDQTNEQTVEDASFMLPVGVNPYVSGSLVQSGYFNVYEQVDAGSYDDVAIFFRPLLPSSSQQQLTPVSIDVDSNTPDQPIHSLYIGGYADGKVIILGRQSSSDPSSFGISPIAFSNLTQSDLTLAGQVVDITHAQDESGDRLYWLQGGTSIAYGIGQPTNLAGEQLIRVGQDTRNAVTFTLQELGLPLTPSDVYGYQALQYIPASSHHPALLLIAGLQGVWSSGLDDDGLPTGFSPMAWEGLPDSGPGAYIRSLQYDPVDDLLIAATQGKGSYLYSFSGDVGARPLGKRILHASNLNLAPNPDPILDKRGNEAEALITFALDDRLLGESHQPRLQFRLHNVANWRKAMEFVSLYNTNVDPSYKTITSATDSAFRYNNILDPVGLDFAGGFERRGDAFFSVKLAGGARIFNLSLNPKDVATLDIKPLKYTVRLAGTEERLTRKVTFDPLPSPGTNPLSVDVVTGMLVGELNGVSAPALHDRPSPVIHEGQQAFARLGERDLATPVELSPAFASSYQRLEPSPQWPAFLQPSQPLSI